MHHASGVHQPRQGHNAPAQRHEQRVLAGQEHRASTAPTASHDVMTVIPPLYYNMDERSGSITSDDVISASMLALTDRSDTSHADVDAVDDYIPSHYAYDDSIPLMYADASVQQHDPAPVTSAHPSHTDGTIIMRPSALLLPSTSIPSLPSLPRPSSVPLHEWRQRARDPFPTAAHDEHDYDALFEIPMEGKYVAATVVASVQTTTVQAPSVAAVGTTIVNPHRTTDIKPTATTISVPSQATAIASSPASTFKRITIIPARTPVPARATTTVSTTAAVPAAVPHVPAAISSDYRPSSLSTIMSPSSKESAAQHTSSAPSCALRIRGMHARLLDCK